MSSSEEYLDNLLKSLTEGGNNTGINAVSSAAQDTGRAEELQDISAPEEADKTMSMDDIEAMIASMGEEAVADEPQTDGTALSSDEVLLDELVDDLPIEENILSEVSALNDEVMSDGSGVGEEAVTVESTLDEGMIPDELPMDGGKIPDEPALDESMLSGELDMGDSMVSDELLMDGGMIPDELVLDESMLSDELDMGDSMVSDELSMDGGMIPDEPVLDESMLSGELDMSDSMVSDGLPMDGGMIPDELALDESMLSGELDMDDSMVSDELPMDAGMLSDELPIDADMLSDELPMDAGMASEENMLSDETVSDESMLFDELLSNGGTAMDEPVLSDEGAMDEFTLSDEGVFDDLGLEESASDELSLDELGLGDLGLEDLGLEERGEEEFGALEVTAPEEESGSDMDFAIEEGEEPEQIAPEGEVDSEEQLALEETGEEDADLSALLASMGGDDDLSEINELLEKSDQGVAIDDEMMAMLDGISESEEGEDAFDFFAGEEGEAGEEEGEPENIREITPEELAERENSKTEKQKKKEEKERKKREKRAKKAKNKEGGSDDESDGLSESMSEGEKTAKESGFFAKLIDFLLEEDDEDADSAEKGLDDVGVVIGNLSDENKELLAELNAEDKEKAKKKGKKDKKEKKEKKEKKGKKKGRKAGEGGEEGAAKPKKPKKEKKKKEESVEEVLKLPEKKLSRKKVVSVFLFCATIAACIIVVTMLLPEQMEKQEARLAYDQGQYTQVYDLLYGKNLSEEEETLLQKSSIVLKMQRKLDSFENYRKLDMQLEALNALIEGVSRYRDLRDEADEYNIGGEVSDIYGQILVELANNYGLSESDALDIISSEDNIIYSQRLQAVVSGEGYGAQEEELPDVMQDVLPEEEEILDRLQGTETE